MNDLAPGRKTVRSKGRITMNILLIEERRFSMHGVNRSLSKARYSVLTTLKRISVPDCSCQDGTPAAEFKHPVEIVSGKGER